jgi:hypothetical protein
MRHPTSSVPVQALACLCFSTLTACVPVVSYEYDVEGQGVKSQSGGCSPTTEVLLTQHLTPTTSVVFWGSVERLHHSHRIVSASFKLSGDDLVTLTKPEVEITSKAYATPRLVPITTIRRSSAMSSPSCDPPDGSVYQNPSEAMRHMPADSATTTIFVIDFRVPENPAEFTIRLAPVLINGKSNEVPAVKFLRKSSVSYSALMK